MTDKMMGWHFLPANGCLTNGDGRQVVVGETYTVDPPLELCVHGLHASERILDALKFAPGPIICRVELSGEILHDDDKACATQRRVLWMADATATLHEFACRVAEDALAAAEVTTTSESWNALEIKRRWLRGEATDNDLSAAISAAWSAARSATVSAAQTAARSAVNSAAWNATVSAAWSAARSAVNSAAVIAAWSAFDSAAWSAAMSGAIGKYNGWLEEMILELQSEQGAAHA